MESIIKRNLKKNDKLTFYGIPKSHRVPQYAFASKMATGKLKLTILSSGLLRDFPTQEAHCTEPLIRACFQLFARVFQVLSVRATFPKCQGFHDPATPWVSEDGAFLAPRGFCLTVWSIGRGGSRRSGLAVMKRSSRGLWERDW